MFAQRLLLCMVSLIFVSQLIQIVVVLRTERWVQIFKKTDAHNSIQQMRDRCRCILLLRSDTTNNKSNICTTNSACLPCRCFFGAFCSNP